MKVAVNSFVKRQTPESQFSHYARLVNCEQLGLEVDWESLRLLVEANLDKGVRGYRDGVLLVPVPPEDFFSSIVQLKNGDKLAGEFSRRAPTEEPRKHVYVTFDSRFLYAGGSDQVKMPAKRVDIVVYSHAVLAENNEHETDADYEIISINASPTDEQMPMTVGTLISNHFGFSGGTATKMTNDEFVAALRVSAEFWKDKSMLAPTKKV